MKLINLADYKRQKRNSSQQDEIERNRRRVKIRTAILHAKSVLKYFEKSHPEDRRPRKAIKAAQDFLRSK